MAEDGQESDDEPGMIRRISKFSSISRDVAATMHKDAKKVREMQSRAKKLLEMMDEDEIAEQLDTNVSVRGKVKMEDVVRRARRTRNSVVLGLQQLEERKTLAIKKRQSQELERSRKGSQLSIVSESDAEPDENEDPARPDFSQFISNTRKNEDYFAEFKDFDSTA